MISIGVFQAIADLATGAKARRDAEHDEFLKFYRELVETIPSAAAKMFGSLKVAAIENGKPSNPAIELTATDYMWWKQHIREKGARFSDGPVSVQLDMLNRLSQQAETYRLEPDERKKLIALLDPTPV